MIRKILPHVCIVLSLMMLVFYIIDLINPAMNFIGNGITKTLLMIFSLCTIAASLMLMSDNDKRKK